MVSGSSMRVTMVVLAGLGFASGCGDDGGPGGERTVAEVVVAVPAGPIEAGDTVQLSAEARDGSGGTIAGLTPTWSSSDNLVAAVEPDGRVRALMAGPVVITATINGVSGTGGFAVQIPSVVSVGLSPGPASLVPGQTVTYQATPRDKRGQPVSGKTVAWSVSPGGVSTVSSAGVVTGVAPGTATLTATVDTAHGAVALTVNEGGVAEPAGGTVSAYGGAFVLEIPPGAVTTTIPFRVARVSAPPLDPDYVGNSGFRLTPALALLAPARVRLTYTPANGPAGLEEDQLGVHTLGGVQWSPADDPAIDTAGNTAQGSTAMVEVVGVHRQTAATSCTAAEHRQFDFWLGNWNFSAPGAFPGTDVITADSQGCVLQEDFHDSSGYHSRSVSFYNPRTGKWYQTFVDTQGGRILLSGGLVGNQMIMNDTPTSRFLWTPVSSMQVVFSGETTSNGGATWSEVFSGTYSR